MKERQEEPSGPEFSPGKPILLSLPLLLSSPSHVIIYFFRGPAALPFPLPAAGLPPAGFAGGAIRSMCRCRPVASVSSGRPSLIVRELCAATFSQVEKSLMRRPSLAPVAMMKAAITRSKSPLNTTIVTRSARFLTVRNAVTPLAPSDWLALAFHSVLAAIRLVEFFQHRIQRCAGSFREKIHFEPLRKPQCVHHDEQRCDLMKKGPGDGREPTQTACENSGPVDADRKPVNALPDVLHQRQRQIAAYFG